MELLSLLGLACVTYTALELFAATRRSAGPRPASFGAVDLDSGRTIVTVCDRRKPGRSDRRARSLPIAV